jgi:hypothetical protein
MKKEGIILSSDLLVSTMKEYQNCDLPRSSTLLDQCWVESNGEGTVLYHSSLLKKPEKYRDAAVPHHHVRNIRLDGDNHNL